MSEKPLNEAPPWDEVPADPEEQEAARQLSLALEVLTRRSGQDADTGDGSKAIFENKQQKGSNNFSIHNSYNDQLVSSIATGDGAPPRDEPLQEGLVRTAALVRSSLGPEQRLGDVARRRLVGQAMAEGAAGRRLHRLRRAAPLLALAASLLLVVSALVLLSPWSGVPGPSSDITTLSRPSDDLLGRPIEDRAGASRRLDRVFDDRLHGYRRLRLGGEP